MRITFNWGTGIALVYIAFAVATTGFVTFAMNRSVDLVSADYYAQSLQQDQQMDAEQNALMLRPAPRWRNPTGAWRFCRCRPITPAVPVES